MSLSLLLHFVRQDLIDRHAASALGALWTLLIPLANILIFTLVFSQIMGARLQALGAESFGEYGYSVYLITGLLPWICFASTLTRITDVYHEKAGLITKIRVSLFSLPVYILISESAIYLISMVFFVIFLLMIGAPLGASWLWLPLIFLTQQLLAYALGLLLAILRVFFRDIKEIVNVVVQFWFWLTPIVYVTSIIPDSWTPIFRVNPMFYTTTAYRDALMVGTRPDLMALGAIIVIALAILSLAIYVGRHLERDIRDLI